jgi:hypothetical protein
VLATFQDRHLPLAYHHDSIAWTVTAGLHAPQPNALPSRADRSPQPQGPTNQVRCDTERNRDHGDFKQAFDRVQAEDPRAAYSTDSSK